MIFFLKENNQARYVENFRKLNSIQFCMEGNVKSWEIYVDKFVGNKLFYVNSHIFLCRCSSFLLINEPAKVILVN